MRRVCKNCASYKPLESFERYEHKVGLWHDNCKECEKLIEKDIMNKTVLEKELFQIGSMMGQLDSVWHHLYMLGVEREKCPITPTLEYLHERYVIVQKELNELTNNKKYETIIKR